VRETGSDAFSISCVPGDGGVIACPCGNPPAGSGLGCNNSSANGGASIHAFGVASLASDTVVFATTGEKTTATSILLQGTSQSASGLSFGQGVRCATGSLKRLFTKTASGGSITAPNFSAGDPSVSVRSAALGDTIAPGTSRWYLVYYRDPIVLGGCPSMDTFNATQTGQIDWSM
jgi:type IV secretory pathway TrbL component